MASRRQTRITALDLISFLAGTLQFFSLIHHCFVNGPIHNQSFLTGEDNPKMWLHMDDGEMERITQTVRDQNLKLTLAFGIGMHHAGLQERDRKTVEELYVNQKIQVIGWKNEVLKNARIDPL